MREYGKVSPTFWTGTTGRALRSRGTEAIVVGFYLMTAPGSNMLGLYYQPTLYMAHETGLGVEGASKGLAAAVEVGFCRYDEATQTVWVVEMAAWQIAEELKASDKRCLGIQRDYEALPENPFLGEFFDRYQASFHLSKRRGLQGASKAHRSKEQAKAKEQEKEQEQEEELSPTAQATPAASPAPVKLELVASNPAPETKVAREQRVVDLVLKLFHELLPKCRKVVVLDPKLRKRILECDRIASKTIHEQGLSVAREVFWEAYFGECQDDPWLSGELKKPDSNWKQNLEVLLRAKHFGDIVARAIERPRDSAEDAA
jgi:hypothetical protein